MAQRNQNENRIFYCLLQQQFEVLDGGRTNRAGIFRNNCLGGSLHGLLTPHDFLFNRILGNQSIAEHMALLADAMRPVDSLGRKSRIPPRVENEHMVGTVQVQALPACFKAE